MIEVRAPHTDELPACLDMVSAFHAASPIAALAPFDRNGMASFLTNLQNDKNAQIWLALKDGVPVGVSAALCYPLYFSPSSRAVQELFWWLEPSARGSGAGGKMFQSIQKWAKDMDAAAVFMIALADERVDKMDRFYKRAGFYPMERTYVKGASTWR